MNCLQILLKNFWKFNVNQLKFHKSFKCIEYEAEASYAMNRVRRLSMLLISQFPDKFSADYEKNKKVLSELAVFRSKSLRNEVAGYITRYFKLKEEEVKEEEPQVEVQGAKAPS